MSKLSLIIPVRNESKVVEDVLSSLVKTLRDNNIQSEILVINDYSTDETKEIIEKISKIYNEIKILDNKFPAGFGYAIKYGLENFKGDYVIIFMGDGSDDPEDVVKYYVKLKEGYDCVFGSRFIKGANLIKYPFIKLILNRLGNLLIKFIFKIKYNDISNAFKGYKKKVIEDIKPLISNDFNITIEIPLKAIIRNYRYAVIPINWYGRKTGESKFKWRNLQKGYLLTIFYLWLEKMLLEK